MLSLVHAIRSCRSHSLVSPSVYAFPTVPSSPQPRLCTACAAASRLMWLQYMPFVMLECVCCGLDKVCVCEKFRAVRNYPSSIIMNAKTGLLSTIVPSSTLLKRCRVVRVLVVNNSPVVSRDCGVRKAWLSRLLILRRRLTPTTGHSDTRQRRGDDEADHCSDHEGVRVQVKGVDA